MPRHASKHASLRSQFRQGITLIYGISPQPASPFGSCTLDMPWVDLDLSCTQTHTPSVHIAVHIHLHKHFVVSSFICCWFRFGCLVVTS
ncbi:hypothetical protein L596_024087 [Steinernema carpocapsae]|uniref:Uncharacterized protein n=1 Tax=Steinernema carpocapsae TaxID=34508 RepID=A0A4U5MFN6_STECR|nr:hypothetical protein L596_024087 [Steinernema carpocapsae]